MRDSHGRTVLHQLAMCTNRTSENRLEVIAVIDEYIAGGVGSILTEIDLDGFTAVAIATQYHDFDFCSAMIKLSSRCLWTFDTIASFAYPLVVLDGASSLIEVGKYTNLGGFKCGDKVPQSSYIIENSICLL